MPCPGLSRCRASCLHRAMVEEYQRARLVDELEREAVTYGYAAEVREYNATVGVRTFWSWLTGGGWEPFRRWDEPA